MSAMLDTVMEIARPADAAREIARLNDRLARVRTIPAEVIRSVREIVSGVTETALDRWEQVDPFLALVIHRAAIQAESAIQIPKDPAARDRLRVALESLRQSFAAIAENQPIADERPPKEIARWLVEKTGVPQARLAALLGVSLRRFQRWVSPQDAASPEGDDARRLQAMARLVNQLRFSLTPAGAVEWFAWPRHDLGGRRPIDLLAEPDKLPELMAIAGSMRGTHAS
jgi:uncharacterized protein (DUF2384 family)